MRLKHILYLALTLAIFTPVPATRAAERGFVSLFDGHSFNGWKLVNKVGDGYGITNGAIFCATGGGGNLFTEKEYSDFVLRFEFNLGTNGSNNGIGIRAPYEGDAAYMGMEIQVIDDNVTKYGPLRPAQHHGAIYDVFAPRVGFQKPPGQWNEEEIIADGRHVKVVLNGHVIVDADLNSVTNATALGRHPGLLRPRGHIGLLGHDDYVEFRKMRIKELARPGRDNKPPKGFKALFNGKNLEGWKGLVADPPARAKMSPEQLSAAQCKADQRMREHWRSENAILYFDGEGDNLCTAKDYGDFEMWVDWKIEAKGDSGIYLRGSPQVQIWDPQQSHVGSGGLFNNEKNPRNPLALADNPLGQWNTFHILMVGEKVTVFLNGELVVHNTTLENYWERSKPIYSVGQIELQNHSSPLYFKNLFIRELPRKQAGAALGLHN